MVISGFFKQSDFPIKIMLAELDLGTKKRLLEHLLSFTTDNKIVLFNRVVEERTRHVTVVLEDIFQPHNASAVLRTCDCFGVQDVHIIENKNTYHVNPDVALGSFQWLSLMKYFGHKNNTVAAYKALKEKGYRIVATTPHKNDVMLDELPIDEKMAFVFGTELKGLSQEAIDNADAYVKIPMYGFTESFNISVATSIVLHHVIEKLKKSGFEWHLTEDEKIDIKLNWAQNTVKRSDLIVKNFIKNA
jgi:tRNA (guanosine-2'-O-)-methyltransferase